MQEVTFGIAVLLATGLLFAKVAQLIRLPSVTGFIVAGLVLGPSCLGLLTSEIIGHQLDHFTQIALMLIAFGIGEHIELHRLGDVAKDVVYISLVQAVAAFVLVAAGIFIAAMLVSGPDGTIRDYFVLALLLGAVSTASAPAAILHVVRELGARGRLTATLLAVVALADGLAIMIFGMAVSVSHQLVGLTGGSAIASVFASLVEICFSLIIGVVTGLLIDFSLHKLHRRGEMLTAGLALLLLCGETTRMLHLSPILAGMMAGFIIINRAERDVRLFRAINAFEPPIYVLFFTLAGVHLDFAALQLAGWLGLVYFLARFAGKYLGTLFGGVFSGAAPVVRNYLGLALVPQAGVAIGLVFMISSDPQVSEWSTVITPVVLAGVVLSELIGPLLVRYTLEKGREVEQERLDPNFDGRGGRSSDLWLKSRDGLALAPWEWDTLHPAANTKGVVVFGAYNWATSRSLARIAVILAHHYHAQPLCVRVLSQAEKGSHNEQELAAMFLPEQSETQSLGYPLQTEVLYDTPASGLVAAIEYNDARAVVLGYPLGRNPLAFQKVLDRVATNVLCPVLAVRFNGVLSCKRILVPFLFPQELEEVLPICEAMATAGRPRITFLQILHADCSPDEIAACEKHLDQWLQMHLVDTDTRFQLEAADSRLTTILEAAHYHDLIVMTAARRHTVQRMFFGSLANSVVHNCKNSVIVVYTPQEGLS